MGWRAGHLYVVTMQSRFGVKIVIGHICLKSQVIIFLMEIPKLYQHLFFEIKSFCFHFGRIVTVYVIYLL